MRGLRVDSIRITIILFTPPINMAQQDGLLYQVSLAAAVFSRYASHQAIDIGWLVVEVQHHPRFILQPINSAHQDGIWS